VNVRGNQQNIPFLLLYTDFGLNYKGKGKAVLIQSWTDS